MKSTDRSLDGDVRTPQAGTERRSGSAVGYVGRRKVRRSRQRRWGGLARGRVRPEEAVRRSLSFRRTQSLGGTAHTSHLSRGLRGVGDKYLTDRLGTHNAEHTQDQSMEPKITEPITLPTTNGNPQ